MDFSMQKNYANERYQDNLIYHAIYKPSHFEKMRLLRASLLRKMNHYWCITLVLRSSLQTGELALHDLLYI